MLKPGAILIVIALAACGPSVDPDRKEIPTAEPISLWSVELLDGGAKPLKTSFICADAGLRKGFVRMLPEVNGQPCRMLDEPVSREDMFAARCRAGEDYFTVNSMIDGDRMQDFTVAAVFNTDDRVKARFERTLHYRRLGDCPAGWEAGDLAQPGDREVVNTLSNARRPLASEFVPPAG